MILMKETLQPLKFNFSNFVFHLHVDQQTFNCIKRVFKLVSHLYFIRNILAYTGIDQPIYRRSYNIDDRAQKKNTTVKMNRIDLKMRDEHEIFQTILRTTFVSKRKITLKTSIVNAPLKVRMIETILMARMSILLLLLNVKH